MNMTLRPDGYMPRLFDRKLEDYLSTFGAVYVKGPKNCGKTWMSRNHSSSEIQLDNRTIEAVKVDSGIALKGDNPHLID